MIWPRISHRLPALPFLRATGAVPAAAAEGDDRGPVVDRLVPVHAESRVGDDQVDPGLDLRWHVPPRTNTYPHSPESTGGSCDPYPQEFARLLDAVYKLVG